MGIDSREGAPDVPRQLPPEMMTYVFDDEVSRLSREQDPGVGVADLMRQRLIESRGPLDTVISFDRAVGNLSPGQAGDLSLAGGPVWGDNAPGCIEYSPTGNGPGKDRRRSEDEPVIDEPAPPYPYLCVEMSPRSDHDPANSTRLLETAAALGLPPEFHAYVAAQAAKRRRAQQPDGQ